MHNYPFIACAIAASGALALSACDLEIGDLNNPGIDEIENTPTPSDMRTAATGLLIGNRVGHGNANGYVAQLGILGREAYSFDASDPRFVSELLERMLNPGSPFGGAFWTPPYANIQLSHVILHALDKIEGLPTGLSDEDKAGIRGFTKTIAALDLLRVTVTHDANGVVIDTDRPRGSDLAPLVDPDVALIDIAARLDDGLTDLMAAGDGGFSFRLSEGFEDFETPSAFIKVNRAIRARVAVYQREFPAALAALAASFIDDDPVGGINLDAGVYYTFTTKGGDATLGLATKALFAHPSVTADAQPGDARLARKTKTVDAPSPVRGLGSNIQFTLYPEPTSSVSLIRNEELLLLKAEALYRSGMQAEGVAELNLVRTLSGGLSPIDAPASEDAFLDALLYERRYSLLFEGHRLIDVRRLNKIAALPLDNPIIDGKEVKHLRNVRWPIPQPECDARVDEPRCGRGSTD